MRNIQLFRRPLLIACSLFASAFCFAQVTEEWVARYNGPGNGDDGAGRIALDNDGNVYVTGSGIGIGTSADYTTIKYNSAGVQQWEARYNGSGNSHDGASALAVDATGNVYVTGRSTGSGTAYDYTTIKYDKQGNTKWVKRYNGPGNGFDEATALAVDEDGNVYVTGYSDGGETRSDYTTIKYDAYGNELWVVRYNGPGNTAEGANALALDPSGNVYVTGQSNNSAEEDPEPRPDFATVKYDANGNELWVVRYNGPGNDEDVANSLAVDALGNVYVTGQSESGGETGTDYLTIKYNEAGVQQWEVRYNNQANGFDRALFLVVDASGNVYVTGFSWGGNETLFDYATIKYNTTGVQQWVARYDGPGNSFDQAAAIALDASGNVYVTGGSYGIGTGSDYATIKYNATGVQQWEARYNGPGIDPEAASALAVDALGNVYVTGPSMGIESGSDFATIKYSQPLPACGTNNNKVLICHKGKNTLCISVEELTDHIAHGDHVGKCAENDGLSVAREGTELSGLITELPARFRVFNAPNPVSTTTKIYYELPAEGHVSIKVFDMLGKEIKTLVDAGRKAGYHSTELNVTAFQKGIYFYRITVKTENKIWVQTGKISVVK